MGIIHEDRKSKQWIRNMRFSPDGFTLAIGSQDNNIYLHDVNSSFSVRAMCTKHNKFITDMDFSVDSATLQSNCGGYELLFCEYLAPRPRHLPALRLHGTALTRARPPALRSPQTTRSMAHRTRRPRR
jgi:hypothetical protein